jgi:hypothetical protein
MAGVGASAVASFLAFGFPGWFTSAFPAVAAAPLFVAAGAVLGAALALGFVFGTCLHSEYTKLEPLGRERVCVAGVVEVVSMPYSQWWLSFLRFTDYVFDIVVRPSYLSLITEFAQNIQCNGAEMPMLRLEIDSRVHRAACVGGMIGAAAGAVLGVVAGIAVGAAIASAACGPFALLCFIAAFIVALLVAAIVTLVVAWVGGMIGSAVGEALDVGEPLLELGATVERGTCLTAEGRWVNDTDHGWNEVHPVVELRLSGLHPGTPPFRRADAEACPDDCPAPPSSFG